MSTIAEFIAKRDDDDLRSVLKTSYGQRFMSRLLLSCGVHRTPMFADSVRITDFNLGKQSIGNAILQEVMRIKPEVYPIMAKMDQEDEDARRNEREQHRDDDN